MRLQADPQAKEALVRACDAALKVGGMQAYKDVTDLLLGAGLIYISVEQDRGAEVKGDQRILKFEAPNNQPSKGKG